MANAPRRRGSTAATASPARLRPRLRAATRWRDDFGVGLALERAPVGDQLLAQRLEVLDDSVVDQRHRSDDVRVSVADGRRAVGRPARVGDADRRRAAARGSSSRARLSSLPSARRRAMAALIDGADASRVIAAIFEALQAIEEPLRDFTFADNPNDTAHARRLNYSV